METSVTLFSLIYNIFWITAGLTRRYAGEPIRESQPQSGRHGHEPAADIDLKPRHFAFSCHRVAHHTTEYYLCRRFGHMNPGPSKPGEWQAGSLLGSGKRSPKVINIARRIGNPCLYIFDIVLSLKERIQS
jgi:hypothetical protein